MWGCDQKRSRQGRTSGASVPSTWWPISSRITPTIHRKRSCDAPRSVQHLQQISRGQDGYSRSAVRALAPRSAAPRRKESRIFGILVGPVTNRPTLYVLVAEEVTRPGSCRGAIMQRTLVAIIVGALVAGGMSLAHHDEH